MYCKHCGSEIENDKAEICVKCGVKVDSLDPPNYCPNCGVTLESTDEEVCHSCGNPISSTISAIKNCGWKTRELKSVSKFIVNRESVDRKLGFFLLMMLPMILITIILDFIFPTYNIMDGFSIISTLIKPFVTLLLTTIFTVVFYNFIWKAIKTGQSELSFKFNKKLYLFLVLFSIVVSIISGIFSFFYALSFIKVLLLGESVLPLILAFIIYLIVLIIISTIQLPMAYLIVSRNYTLGKAIKVGGKLGFKYFWKILVLSLSFIPLAILCIITIFILFIFKGTYMTATEFILLEKICQEENL